MDEKRQKYNEAKMLFVQAEVAHPNMKPQEVKLLLIKERLGCMTPHGKWRDRRLDHPFPAMSEPEKAVAFLGDLGEGIGKINHLFPVD